MLQKLSELNQNLKEHSIQLLTAIGTRLVYWLGVSASAWLFTISGQKPLEFAKSGWRKRVGNRINPTKMY